MLYRSKVLAEEYFHSFAMLLFAFSTFTSTARLDHNCAFALLAFFFVRRDKTKYSFNSEQYTVFFWLCVFSCVIDITWISLYANADQVYDHSVLHKLASTVKFVTTVSIIEFVVVKLPFVVMLFLMKGLEDSNIMTSIPAEEINRPNNDESWGRGRADDARQDLAENAWDMQNIQENSRRDPDDSMPVEVTEAESQQPTRSVNNVSLEIEDFEEKPSEASKSKSGSTSSLENDVQSDPSISAVTNETTEKETRN